MEINFRAMFAVIFVLGGCGSDDPSDPDATLPDATVDSAEPDATPDAEPDAQPDAQPDADASVDASVDGDAESATMPYATLMDECNAGPFARSDVDTGAPCVPDPEPSCPSTPTEGARPITIVATCGYGRDETGCEPLLVPGCADADGDVHDFSLINPNPGVPFGGCWGRVHLHVEPNAEGTVDVEWAAEATDRDCEEVGAAEGTLEVAACCEQTIDLYFPHGEFTLRVAVRVDWY